MKNDKLIPGIILVLIGAAFLLHNYGYLHFHWENFFRLWPIFLVIGGINLVFANNRSSWATILKISVVILGFGLLLFANFGERYNFWPGWHYSYHNDNDDNDNNNSKDDDDDDDDDDNNSKTAKYTIDNAFNEPYTANVKVARLNISGGATAYDINQSTDGLFDASFRNNSKRYELSHNMDDSVYVLDFKMKDHNGIEFGSHNNAVNMRLNPNPVWEVNVDAGAAAIDFDLSKFKVKEVKLHGGAASFKVKLGMPLDVTDVDVSTGISGVDISIPNNAACTIDTDSGLSGNDFEGFTKTGDDTYETPGYAQAKNKMHIHISGGLSGFHVKRY